MKLIPILTEKSLELAKDGKYTFWVDRNSTKPQVKKLVSDIFNVAVANVRTINLAGETKRTMAGKKKIIKPRKKAVVTLKGKDKIDLFEEKK
jgi:large subunit ribosomal protein L23